MSKYTYNQLIASSKFNIESKYVNTLDKDSFPAYQGFYKDGVTDSCERQIYKNKQIIGMYDKGRKIYEFILDFKKNKYTFKLFGKSNESSILKPYKFQRGTYYGELNSDGEPRGIGLVYFSSTKNIDHGVYFSSDQIATICNFNRNLIVK